MTDDSWPDDFEPTPLVVEAVSLIADVDEDPSESNLVALKAWYEMSGDHRRAFASAMFSSTMAESTRRQIEESLGRKFDVIPELPGVDRAKPPIGGSEGSVQPWGPRQSSAARPPRSSSRGRRPVVIGMTAAASAAIIAFGIGFMSRPMFSPIVTPALAQTFQTGHAEIRSFSLSDGSDMTLDSDTRVEVTIDSTRRRALLQRGRVRFMVKADPRPFTIKAMNGQVVTAQGTVDVEVDSGDQADISLRAGTATVQVDGRAAEPLMVGQPVVYAPESAAPTPAAIPDNTRDWPAGWAEYRTISLGALIAQANRYATAPIILDDPSLATLQASGRFKLTDTANFARWIAETFGLRVSRRDDGIHLGR